LFCVDLVQIAIMQLRDLEVYKLSMLIGDKVWEAVNRWDSFEKNTLGKQLVRSADSIALNIAEGFPIRTDFCFFIMAEVRRMRLDLVCKKQYKGDLFLLKFTEKLMMN
jgi:hypothetical protein